MLKIHDNAVRLVTECVLIARQIEKHDGDLARQLRRAIVSVPLNVAEGSDQPGKRRELHYRIAMGSAREALSALTVAHAAGYTGAVSENLKREFDAVIGVLHSCVFK